MRVRGHGRHVLSTLVPILSTVLLCASETPDVHVAPLGSVGPRAMETQTQESLARDYLRAWQTMIAAFQQNQPEMLDGYFVGTAKEQLSNTFQQEQRLGIQKLYRDQSHDLRVLFYSPEGLSIQLIDGVQFEIELRDQGKVIGRRQVRTNYMVVLTPAESRWKVRVFQSGMLPTLTPESAVHSQPLSRNAQSKRAKELLA